MREKKDFLVDLSGNSGSEMKIKAYSKKQALLVAFLKMYGHESPEQKKKLWPEFNYVAKARETGFFEGLFA